MRDRDRDREKERKKQFVCLTTRQGCGMGEKWKWWLWEGCFGEGWCTLYDLTQQWTIPYSRCLNKAVKIKKIPHANKHTISVNIIYKFWLETDSNII